MTRQVKVFLKENKWYLLSSFLLPALIMAVIYLTMGIFPGSARSVLASDAFSQFSNFHASYRNMLLGKQGFLYTWNASLGLNYLSLVSYYLGGIFTPLVILFPNQLMPDALYFLTLIKIGSAGLAFWFYAKHTFQLKPWSHVVLALFYSLMSFATAHSELIMWLDGLVYLPLVIWGIDRILQLRKPRVLFFSYLLLFLSSFYMGFMIGVFSFLYFVTRLAADFKTNRRRVPMYLLTSFLAGGASMIIILPAVTDLMSNGETLSQFTKLKTDATSWLDLIMKNMVGVYDTTKYGSIPFIYAGLLPLVLCLFYFVSKKIRLRDKLLNLSLLVILTVSFYFAPLNLFWHGMHAPNMFLFRYAFLFSFMVMMLAGYGWSRYQEKDRLKLVLIFSGLIGVFLLSFALRPKGSYEYVSFVSLVLTICFLLLYLLLFAFPPKKVPVWRGFTLLLLLTTIGETALNTNGMLRGILEDWNYASRSLYTEPYPDISKLVNKTKASNENFYRLENLDPVSSNDGFNYGYSGISMFSSIRNRHSSGYLNELGFRSRGTNLNIRYPNNTLMMDSFAGVKYNLSKTSINKYGFKLIDEAGSYKLYENTLALPLAFTAAPEAAEITRYPNDKLSNQTLLFNGLTGLQQTYFSFHPISVVSQNNVTLSSSGIFTHFKEEKPNQAKEVTWRVAVPANSQAYLSLYPYDFAQLESSSVTVSVNGEQRKSQINITGQYYDLGHYDKAQTVEFTASFYGTDEVSFQNPQVVTLNTDALQTAVDQLKTQGVPMKTSNHGATGTVDLEEDQLLITTIPYEKGWSATIDGQAAKVIEFQDGLVSVKVPKGKHEIKLSYLPEGFKTGALLFVGCLVLFGLYDQLYLKRSRNKCVNS